MKLRVVILPGDGIGPEIMVSALAVLDKVGSFVFDERVLGGAAIDAHGTALTDEEQRFLKRVSDRYRNRQ
jgi:3-isopropylmalate dehydrogenase